MAPCYLSVAHCLAVVSSFLVLEPPHDSRTNRKREDEDEQRHHVGLSREARRELLLLVDGIEASNTLAGESASRLERQNFLEIRR